MAPTKGSPSLSHKDAEVLAENLPAHARLILLGDRNPLASVET